MIFNSVEFLIFLPIVFILYWGVFRSKIKQQNFLLLGASYFFYGWWDWRFLLLILCSSCLDYFIAINLHEKSNVSRKKALLIASLFFNLGLLFFFKYFNFFIESFEQAYTFLGYSLRGTSLNIILPVGISFYTFQTLSYTIDVYRGKILPTKNFGSFLTYVSFFPQLVAGPIERAINLLPQFEKKRNFNVRMATDGLRQMLWGLFKKVVIADNCADYVNSIYLDYSIHNSGTLLLAAILFSIQIYCDFSGYSDVAIGTSRLFGFVLMKNFSFPYFSRNIAEFWRRWHISLSTWFRDYLYVPLGGSKVSDILKTRNIMIIFLVSGFWHGANWTFIFWGFLNALYFLPSMLFGKNRKFMNSVAEGKILPNFKELFKMMQTFFLTTLAWVFFRSDTIYDAVNFLKKIISLSDPFEILNFPTLTVILIFLFICIEWIQREKEHGLELHTLNYSVPRFIRWSIYISIIICILCFPGSQQEFIYFQF